MGTPPLQGWGGTLAIAVPGVVVLLVAMLQGSSLFGLVVGAIILVGLVLIVRFLASPAVQQKIAQSYSPRAVVVGDDCRYRCLSCDYQWQWQTGAPIPVFIPRPDPPGIEAAPSSAPDAPPPNPPQ
jgi:hypothetical protein